MKNKKIIIICILIVILIFLGSKYVNDLKYDQIMSDYSTSSICMKYIPKTILVYLNDSDEIIKENGYFIGQLLFISQHTSLSLGGKIGLYLQENTVLFQKYYKSLEENSNIDYSIKNELKRRLELMIESFEKYDDTISNEIEKNNFKWYKLVLFDSKEYRKRILKDLSY